MRQSGLPALIEVTEGNRVQIVLRPQPSWVHLSNDVGLAEAPFPYHISLCRRWEVQDEATLDRIRTCWHGRVHRLMIERVSPRATAMVDEGNELHRDGDVMSLRAAGHGVQLSISM